MNKKTFINGLVGAAIGGILIFGITTCSYNNSNKVLNKVDKVNTAQENQEEEQEQQTNTKEEIKEDNKAPSEVTLNNGNFICGKNFEVGTYDVIAVKGSGNVSCMDNGFIEMMGTDKENKKVESQGIDNMFQNKYSNVKFKKGDKLKVDRVTIKLIKK